MENSPARAQGRGLHQERWKQVPQKTKTAYQNVLVKENRNPLLFAKYFLNLVFPARFSSGTNCAESARQLEREQRMRAA
jgi:hypothetical protein